MDAPKKEWAVSVIVPAHNAADTISRTLNSLLAQTTQDFECIVVDDASADGTTQVVGQFIETYHLSPRWRILSGTGHQFPQGVSCSRNQGIRASVGEFVFFLDADDELEASCLGTLLATQQKCQADITCCNILRCHPDGQVRAMGERPVGRELLASPENPDDFQEILPFLDSSCAKLFRRSLLDAVQLQFQAGMPFGEDTLFSCCAALKARRVVVLPDYWGYRYLLRGSSCSARIDVRGRLASLELLLRNLDRETPENLKRILLRKSCEDLWTIRK